MSNWKRLENAEYQSLWDLIYDVFFFKPNDGDCSILLPEPNICFDISGFYNEEFSENLHENLEYCLHKWFRFWQSDDKIYALNWQHECYSFTPDLPFEKDEFGEWLVPAFPNGDFLFFLSHDLANGIFSDGINFRFCIWGEKAKIAFENSSPMILTKQL